MLVDMPAEQHSKMLTMSSPPFFFPHHAGTTLRDHRTSDRNILITPPK
jgi:hypothetical protein